MLAVRLSQLTQGMTNPRTAPGVEGRPWADAVARTLNAEKVMPGLRIPDAAGYLADLSNSRVAAMTGTESVEVALARLEKAWPIGPASSASTARLGITAGASTARGHRPSRRDELTSPKIRREPVMGKVLVTARIENLGDLFAVDQERLTSAEVRTIEVDDALVDTGATGLSMPRSLLGDPRIEIPPESGQRSPPPDQPRSGSLAPPGSRSRVAIVRLMSPSDPTDARS